MKQQLCLLIACCSLLTAAAQNVGIGTSTPAARLEVAGGLKVTDSVSIGTHLRISGGAPGAGKVLTSDATGLATWMRPAPAAVFLPTVVIGTQQWMNKNLDVAYYRNGDAIPQVRNQAEWVGLTTGAWCYNYNDSTLGGTYGKLYNWYAVNDPRGLAPYGWHIPDNAEWDVLETTMGGSTIAGAPLKEAGNSHWAPPNTGANNNSGFSALPGGFRGNFGTFSEVGSYGLWWSATEYDGSNAFFRYLRFDNKVLYNGADVKLSGFSVRCIRD
ncbi:MAG: hypothetical protein EOP51_22940 [Sphingobacteriales bacterium]|nr:MAG: hypothetical protein EOP51_22940 [Sphingobacteriales bacterium]